MMRILTVLTVALVMAAMMLVIALPAFAATPACRDAQKANWTCQGNTLSNGGGQEKGTFVGQP
jgi:hypothetical protein